ncbi:MAG TPA: DUF5666 domain-containing protein [Candidatus Angelobacter sp.]|nr:DUF5666 domain-containing protein [Candidatus Angelobacter sp.]
MRTLVPIAVTILLAQAAFSETALLQSGSAPTAFRPTQGQEQGRMSPDQKFFVGKVVSVAKDSIVITPVSGNGQDVPKGPITIKVGENTRISKQREPIKLDAIKAGDTVFVSGQASGDTMNAARIGVVPPEMADRMRARLESGATGNGGTAAPDRPAFRREDLGKKFIVGEVKAIQETKLTIARIDNQTQDIEVDENTSFKKGNESITLPDIKVGDFVRGGGEIKNGVFVPKELVVGQGNMMRGMNRQNGTTEQKKPEDPSPKN